ncbi:cilia- and flagella-associated protein 157-like [Photinus pyralis]|nr:cilia- and flagella-associated protein 157-like [Photinus pyralis]
MGKGSKPKEADPSADHLSEVDKTFYELTIADLNRKIARLKTLTEELEVKNVELQKNLKTLDEDRNDVIAYLKRVIRDKTEEVKDFHERLTGIEEAREGENKTFKKEIASMKDEYKIMHEQLTSEIKLLNGKMNSLDEFRAQKEELMKKFEAQEKEILEQEVRHKRELYATEKKFVVGKDNLKKDMEKRLLQLSTDFQNVTEMRIASTTHRVIRENIAINNELDAVFTTQKRLHNDNKALIEENRKLRLDASLYNDEKKKVLKKNLTQVGIISKLTEKRDEAEQKLGMYKKVEAESVSLKRELLQLNNEKEKLQFTIRILEQNLHASRCERNGLATELRVAEDELKRLSEILKEAVYSIKAALMIKPVKGKMTKIHDRKPLLSNLLKLMDKGQENIPRSPSLESVDSTSAIYAKGDLGFVPKPVILRSRVPTRRHREVQVSASFEDFLTRYVPKMDIQDTKKVDTDNGIDETRPVVQFSIERITPDTTSELKQSEEERAVFESSELESSSTESHHVDDYVQFTILPEALDEPDFAEIPEPEEIDNAPAQVENIATTSDVVSDKEGGLAEADLKE